MIRIEDVNKNNIDDIFRVCSYNRLNDPLQRKGMDSKRKWIINMLENYGPCTKIAYVEGKPIAQLLFYPEKTIPYSLKPREDVLILHCVYNPFKKVQRKGVATALLNGLIEECKKGVPCLDNRPCQYIIVKPFEAGEGIPLKQFFTKRGFRMRVSEMYLELQGKYRPKDQTEYKSSYKDKGKAFVFFEPLCEWGYSFAFKVKRFLQKKAPHLLIELINSWDRPQEYLKRGNHWLIVNAVPIESFWSQRKQFNLEVEKALERK